MANHSALDDVHRDTLDHAGVTVPIAADGGSALARSARSRPVDELLARIRIHLANARGGAGHPRPGTVARTLGRCAANVS